MDRLLHHAEIIRIEGEARALAEIGRAPAAHEGRHLCADEHVGAEPRHAEGEEQRVADPEPAAVREQRALRREVEQLFADDLAALPVHRATARAQVPADPASPAHEGEVVHPRMVELHGARTKEPIRERPAPGIARMPADIAS
jgi:hypothetical protein